MAGHVLERANRRRGSGVTVERCYSSRTLFDTPTGVRPSKCAGNVGIELEVNLDLLENVPNMIS